MAAAILNTSLWNEENGNIWVLYSVHPFQSDHTEPDVFVKAQKVWLPSNFEWFLVMLAITYTLVFLTAKWSWELNIYLPYSCEAQLSPTRQFILLRLVVGHQTYWLLMTSNYFLAAVYRWSAIWIQTTEMAAPTCHSVLAAHGQCYLNLLLIAYFQEQVMAFNRLPCNLLVDVL